VEIVGLVMEVCMPGHPIYQTWHPLISTCGDSWRMWCIRRNHRYEVNSYTTSWMVLLSYRTIMKAWKATRAVLKWACLCIANAGVDFKH
jgi:hypothetical protein